MQTTLSLKNLTDDNLETEIKQLVAREREVLVRVLVHLRKVENRKLFLKCGFDSLFSYCVTELGYAEASAYRRISAMRMIKGLPEVQDKIEAGVLTLSNIAAVQMLVKREEKRLPGQQMPVQDKRELLAKVENLSKRECERVLIEHSPALAVPQDRERVLSQDKTEIRFVAGHQLMAKLEKLRALLSHSLIDPSYAELIEKLADEVLKRKDSKQKTVKAAKNAKAEAVSLPPAETPLKRPGLKSRYIPSHVRRALFQRDEGCCQHRDESTGRVCRSRFQLQIDHLVPHALGGPNTLENLQLTCRQHNIYRAAQTLGAGVMERYSLRK